MSILCIWEGPRHLLGKQTKSWPCVLIGIWVSALSPGVNGQGLRAESQAQEGLCLEGTREFSGSMLWIHWQFDLKFNR